MTGHVRARPSAWRAGMVLFLAVVVLVVSGARPAVLAAQTASPDRDDNRELTRNTGFTGRITEGDVDTYSFSVGDGETISVRWDTLSGNITRWGVMLDRPNDTDYNTVFLVDGWGMFTFEGKYPLWVGRYTIRLFAGDLASYQRWNDGTRRTPAPLSVLQGPGAAGYAITMTTFEPKGPPPVPALTATAIPGYHVEGGPTAESKVALRVRMEAGGRDVEQACIDTQRIGGRTLEPGELLFGVTRAGVPGCNPAAERDFFQWPGALVRNDKPGGASVDFDTITPVSAATGENRIAQLPFAMELEGWGLVPVNYEGSTIKMQVTVTVPVTIDAWYRVTLKREGGVLGGAARLNGQVLQLETGVPGQAGWLLEVPADSVLRVNFLDGSLGLIFFPHPDIYYTVAPWTVKTTVQPVPPSGVPWTVETAISSWNADDAGFVAGSGWTGNPVWDELVMDVLVDAVSQRLAVIKSLWEFFSSDLGGASPSDSALVKVRVR